MNVNDAKPGVYVVVRATSDEGLRVTDTHGRHPTGLKGVIVGPARGHWSFNPATCDAECVLIEFLPGQKRKWAILLPDWLEPMSVLEMMVVPSEGS